jgi:hypothetical protein
MSNLVNEITLEQIAEDILDELNALNAEVQDEAEETAREYGLHLDDDLDEIVDIMAEAEFERRGL